MNFGLWGGCVNFEFLSYLKAMFGSGKYKGKKKNAKKNDFLMFGCPMKNIKENQI